MFEHRTEAEMRLHSEKTARELALKRRQKESSDNNGFTEKSDAENSDIVENDDDIDTPPRAGEAHVTTETTITTDAERAG